MQVDSNAIKLRLTCSVVLNAGLSLCFRQILETLAPAKLEHRFVGQTHGFPASDYIRKLTGASQILITSTSQAVKAIIYSSVLLSSYNVQVALREYTSGGRSYGHLQSESACDMGRS